MSSVEPSAATTRLTLMRRALLLLPVLALAVIACGAHSDPQAGISGPPPSVRGRLLGVGGPAGSVPRHWAGRITLTADDGSVTTVHTDAHGRFSLSVLSGAGRYSLTGTSPRYGAGVCHARRAVTIREHQTVRVDVICPLR